jgi:hypothetical protein
MSMKTTITRAAGLAARSILLSILSTGLVDPAAAQLRSVGSQEWTQFELLDTPEFVDQFGRVTAAGDFDGDGLDDLAIGVFGEDYGAIEDAGIVHVLYSDAGGLSSDGEQLWFQDLLLGIGNADVGARFGAALAACNFDGDAYDDLAIGVPFDDGGVGAVHVLYGGPSGLTATGAGYWRQGYGLMAGDTVAGDQFGNALACGNFDGDGADDLAIGVTGEDVGAVDAAGEVHVMYGHTTFGLTIFDNFTFGQTELGATAETQDRFGAPIVSCDFDGNGYDDLAIGVRSEDQGEFQELTDVGWVHVVYSDEEGLDPGTGEVWLQGAFGVPDAIESFDFFGADLACADFDGDGYDDLAIGVFAEDDEAAEIEDAGAVDVLYGTASGLTGSGSQHLTQDVLSGASSGEDEHFGRGLASGDFDADGYDDLAIGSQGEVVHTMEAGVVHVVRGGPTGLDPAEVELWHEGRFGLVGAPETGDAFGASLEVGDFMGDGFADLVVGVFDEDVTYPVGPLLRADAAKFAGPAVGPKGTILEEVNAGAVVVIYGYLFADGFETGTTGMWSATSP